MERPRPAEYNEFYAGYVAKAGANPVAQLERQCAEVRAFQTLGDERAAVPPLPGEWSAKQILGHLCDAERIFSYRALRVARDDALPLHGFEQNDYVAAAESNDRPLADLVEEFVALRRATVMLFRSFTDTMVARQGNASGHPVTARALVFITAGHCEGHLADIRRDYPMA